MTSGVTTGQPCHHGLRRPMERVSIDRMERTEKLVTRYLNDLKFQQETMETVPVV